MHNIHWRRIIGTVFFTFIALAIVALFKLVGQLLG